MESVDQQFRQLKEKYEHMTEGELNALAEKAYDLTEIAREALQAVIMEKGVDVRLKMDPLAPLPPEDEDLVVFRWELNIEEAGHTMKTLAAAGIPSFLSLEVRADDVKRAHAAMDREVDAEIEEDDPEENKEFAIFCPKCHSAKVVLKGRTSTLEASPRGVKYQWSCDACGHQWVDDGWVQEVAGGQSWPGEEFRSRDEDSSDRAPK
jgi:DNA-directed RNA polymerase subunit M/transcription elongation factor TFIIS